MAELVDSLLDDDVVRMTPSSCGLLFDMVDRRRSFDFRPVLFQCVDHGLEDIAVRLIVELGADFDMDDYYYDPVD